MRLTGSIRQHVCIINALHNCHSDLRHLGGGQQSNITLPLPKPRRINQLLALWVDELVGIADGAITDTRYGGDVLGCLGLAHEMRRHVYTCRCDRQRGSTCKRADLVRLRCNLLRDLGDGKFKVQLSTVTIAERRGICRLSVFVVVVSRAGAF